jgi:predicted nucleic acid-binding protein
VFFQKIAQQTMRFVKNIDSSDRKFLATAVKAKATIVNATDSDWAEQKTLLETLQIEIKQLCPEHSYK